MQETAFPFKSFFDLLKECQTTVSTKVSFSDNKQFERFLEESSQRVLMAMSIRPDRVHGLYTHMFKFDSTVFQLATITTLFYSHLTQEMEDTLLSHIELGLSIDGPNTTHAVLPKSFRELCPVSLSKGNAFEEWFIRVFKRRTRLNQWLRSNKPFVVIHLLTLMYWMTPTIIVPETP